MTRPRVWVTRTEPGCSRQAKALEAAGYDVLAAPVLGVAETGAERPAGSFQHVFFLSEQAVRAAGDLSFCTGAEVHAVGTANPATPTTYVPGSVFESRKYAQQAQVTLGGR